MRTARSTGRAFKSPYKGVSRNRTTWMAHCKKIYVGCFKTAQDAAKAYDKAARELFGEHAKLNFPL